MAKELLIETILSTFQILEESSPKNGGRMKVKGIFGSADEINGNGRVYPEIIQDREIEKLKPLIEDRCIYSEADHPDDGKSRVRFTAAMPISIEKKTVDTRKVYVGEALILNTTQGMNLQEIIRAGGKIGVSQRGFGSLVKGDWKGKQADIVQEDYSLKTWDFVIGQSTKDAVVGGVTEQMGMDVINLIEVGPCEDCQQQCESKNQKGGIVMEIKTIEELRKAYPELVGKVEEDAATKKEKEIRETLQKEFDGKVLKEVESKRTEIRDEVIEEIKKSDEFVGMVGTFVEINKLIKPYIGEGAGEGEDDDTVAEQLGEIKGKLEAMEKENKALKEQLEADKKAVADKEKATAKITELCAGKEHEKLLVERLSTCKTAEEVVAGFADAEKFIAAVAPKKVTEEKGKAIVEDENKGGEQLTEDQKRDQRIAGIA